jgi:hypothetical protein
MGIRDSEIERLIHYAKSLGVKVTIYNKTNRDASAEWAIDGSQINIYAGPGTSKTTVILNLLHELGHHCWWIWVKDRQPDLKFEEALTRENMFMVETDKPTPKDLRKKIYDVELAGTAYWEIIAKEINIKLPLWKIHAAMEVDMWMYEVYYETGNFPKGKFKRDHVKEVKRKYRPK